MTEKPVFTCKHCGSSHVRFMAHLLYAAPINYYNSVTKAMFKDKEVEIWDSGSNGDVSIYCIDCGRLLLDRFCQSERYEKLKNICNLAEEGPVKYGLEMAIQILNGEEITVETQKDAYDLLSDQQKEEDRLEHLKTKVCDE